MLLFHFTWLLLPSSDTTYNSQNFPFRNYIASNICGNVQDIFEKSMLHLLVNLMPQAGMQFYTYSVLKVDVFSVFPIRMHLKTQIFAQEENFSEP